MTRAASFDHDSTLLAEQYDQFSTRQYANGLNLLDALQLRSGEAVLDVGCGTGLLTEAAWRRVAPDGEVLHLAQPQ